MKTRSRLINEMQAKTTKYRWKYPRPAARWYQQEVVYEHRLHQNPELHNPLNESAKMNK